MSFSTYYRRVSHSQTKFISNANELEDQDVTKDVEFIQRLSAFTNVIPLIGKSETLTTQELISLKTSILARLQVTSTKPFLFGKPLDDALLAVQGLDIVYPLTTPTTAIHTSGLKGQNQFPFPTPTHPYAISSAFGSDNNTMDASLLMSPDYVQPLMPSELSSLIEQVFDPESIAWLKHAAAKKFLAWQRRTKFLGSSFVPHGLQQARSPTTASVGLNGTMMNRKNARFCITPSTDMIQHLQHPPYSPSLHPRASWFPTAPLPSTHTCNRPSSLLLPAPFQSIPPPSPLPATTPTITFKPQIFASQNGLQTYTNPCATSVTGLRISNATSAQNGFSNVWARKSQTVPSWLLRVGHLALNGRLCDTVTRKGGSVVRDMGRQG